MGRTDVTSALIVQWGLPLAGREGKAVGLYRATWQWLLELKEADRIAEVRIYGPLTGPISRRTGFMLVEGSKGQIEELRSSEDFRRTVSRFVTLVQDVRVELLETGEAMHERIARYAGVADETVG